MVTKNDPTDGAMNMTVIAATDSDSPYTLDRVECPALIHNEGAAGALVVNLPIDAKGGEVVEAVCLAAQDIAIDPGDGNRIIGSDGTAYGDLADGKQVIGDAKGETIKLVCLGPDDNGDIEWLAVRQHDNAPAAADNFNEEQS